MSRGRLLAIVGAVAVLVLAAGVVWFGGIGQAVDTRAHPAPTSAGAQVTGVPASAEALSPSSVAAPSDGRPGSPALTQAQADLIASGLVSSDTAQVVAVLAEGVRADYEASPSPILASGEVLTIGAPDVLVTDQGRAAGLVRSQGSAGSTRWALSLVLENGQWKVLEMTEVSAP